MKKQKKGHCALPQFDEGDCSMKMGLNRYTTDDFDTWWNDFTGGKKVKEIRPEMHFYFEMPPSICSFILEALLVSIQKKKSGWRKPEIRCNKEEHIGKSISLEIFVFSRKIDVNFVICVL